MSNDPQEEFGTKGDQREELVSKSDAREEFVRVTLGKSSCPRVTQEKSSVQGWLGRRVRSEGDSWKEFGSEGDRREELVARSTQDKSSPEQSSPRYPRAVNARVHPKCESSRGTLARSRGELSEKYYCTDRGKAK